MCEDHTGNEASEDVGAEQPRRRSILKAAALTTAATGLGTLERGPRAAAAPNPGAFSMAMHVHASFSEGWGSMAGQLSEAQANNVDVVWWTEHDTKLNGMSSKKVVHFTSLTAETGDGAPWEWAPKRIGSLTTASGGGIVASPASPLDTVPQGSLKVTAQSAGAATATFAFQPANVPSRQTWRTNLTQQSLAIEVMPTAIGPSAYLEFRLICSHHPATGGRTAGTYTLSYRIGGAAKAGTRTATDRLGVVTLPAAVGKWNSLVLRPQQDLAALFPDLVAGDMSLHNLWLGASSRGSVTASGYFDYLRFTRPITGEAALSVQDDLMTTYASRYPSVTQQPGLEISHYMPHINWYGGAVALPSYAGATKTNWHDYVRQTVVPDVHRAGGLASYNHPYGTGFLTPHPPATQDRMLSDVARLLLPSRACDADIMEVGYPMREGVDLAHHTGLWDVLSRNAIFVTGNGVSDDHNGFQWTNPPTVTTWTTSVWAADKTEASLLGALRAGRAWCGSLTGFAGALDLQVDDVSPMGSATVRTVGTRLLRLTATQMPAGSALEVVRGVVDFAGTASPGPSSGMVATVPAADLASGSVSLSVDTATECFVRTQVRDAAGVVVALSNPVWLLRSTPPGGIPAERAG